jgi:putative transposase
LVEGAAVQGNQFTSAALTAAPGMRISMDERGRRLDHVVIERPWQSLKDTEVHSSSVPMPRGLRQHRHVDRLYNARKLHPALDFGI